MAIITSWRYMVFQACACCACGLLLGTRSAATRRVPIGRKGGSEVSVFVSDFIDGFPGPAPSMSQANISMDGLYGKPICTGDDSFIPDSRDAPLSFCRYEMLQPDTSMHPDVDFDQYVLERVMLAKWQQSPHRCFGGPTCGDIVVVPSLTLHQMLQLGFSWSVFVPSEEEGLRDARKYWDEVRSRYHKPEQSFTPIVVIHASMVWENQNHFLLQALVEQPSSFISKVALPGIESNVNFEDEKLLSAHDGPFLMTLPYPTSLLKNVHFNQDDGTYIASKGRNIILSLIGVQDKGDEANKIRGFVWEKMASAGSEIARSFMLSSRVSGDYHPKLAKMLVVCNDEAPFGPNCGLGDDMNLWTLTANSIFCLEPAGDTPTRSHFYIAVLSGCIPVVIDGGHELFNPSTPTWWAWRRKQVQTGHELLSKDGADFQDGALNYTSFAIVFHANDLIEGRVDLMKELMEMPTKNPKRLQSLRTNLDKVAPLMRYAKDPCSAGDWHSSASPDCRDAFTAAQQVLVEHAERNAA